MQKQQRKIVCCIKRSYIYVKLNAFTLLDADSARSRLSPNVHTIAFDFQQNLPLPHIPVGEFFYLRQLWLYVFGIHSCSDLNASMYCWDESVAKKGANEVISCIDDYLSNLGESVDTLCLYTDGCGGQNKNKYVMIYLYSLVKSKHFNK